MRLVQQISLACQRRDDVPLALPLGRIDIGACEASLALGYLPAQLRSFGLPRFPLALQVREAGGGIGVGAHGQLVLELVPLGA